MHNNNNSSSSSKAQGLWCLVVLQLTPPLRAPLSMSASTTTTTTTTIKHESSPATSYTVQVQQGDIPSDGTEHQVTIAKIPLETVRLE
jgi:hypothetical protein